MSCRMLFVSLPALTATPTGKLASLYKAGPKAVRLVLLDDAGLLITLDEAAARLDELAASEALLKEDADEIEALLDTATRLLDE